MDATLNNPLCDNILVEAACGSEANTEGVSLFPPPIGPEQTRNQVHAGTQGTQKAN
jgi:hypothetical protein